ncbi:hypothetical protein ES705_15340 [subsurface metagenome]
MESKYLEDRLVLAIMTDLYERPVEELRSNFGPEEFARLTERVLSGELEYGIRAWVRKNFPEEPRPPD